MSIKWLHNILYTLLVSVSICTYDRFTNRDAPLKIINEPFYASNMAYSMEYANLYKLYYDNNRTKKMNRTRSYIYGLDKLR